MGVTFCDKLLREVRDVMFENILITVQTRTCSPSLAKLADKIEGETCTLIRNAYPRVNVTSLAIMGCMGMQPPENIPSPIWPINTHNDVILGEFVHAVGENLHRGPGSARSGKPGSLERSSGDSGALHFP